MSFPRYSKYKASGVKWLGEVPEHWEVKRLKHVASIAMGQSPNSEDCNSDGNGLPFLQGNADFGDSCPTARSFCPVATKLADPGDILLSVRAPVGAINLADQKYGIGRGLCAIRSAPGNTVRFLLHALTVMKTELFSVATGSTYEAVTTQQVGNVVCLVPPLHEQTAIAAFLDRETGKIDALVAEQRRLMELLKEKRQAVISHAVTRGLNPAAPMKNSGIDWLGPVPEHWEVMTLRRCTRCVQTGGTPSSEPPSTNLDEGVVWFTPGDFGDTLRLTTSTRKISHAVVTSGEVKIFPAKSVLVVSIGATLGKVGFSEEASSANQQINAVIPNERIDGYFLAYSLLVKAEVMRFLSNASTIGIMNQEKTKDIWLAVPPVEEQVVVTAFLDTELAKFDTLTAEAQRAIDLLQERRTALISAAVTGQIDVQAVR